MLSLSLRILNGSFLPTMTSACVHTDRGNRRRHPQMFTVMFCLLFVVPSRGDVSQEMVQSVEKATELLSERFQGIRRDILGADALAVSRIHLYYICECAFVRNIISDMVRMNPVSVNFVMRVMVCEDERLHFHQSPVKLPVFYDGIPNVCFGRQWGKRICLHTTQLCVPLYRG